MKKNNNFYFVAGRSGGHLIPCFTLAKKIANSNPSCMITLITTATELEKTIASKVAHIHKHKTFNLDNFPYKKIKKYPKFLWQLFYTFASSLVMFVKNRPVKIISSGGYISIPVCIAAKLLFVPIELYELNAIPGKTIRFLSPITNKVSVCFAEAQKFFKKTKCHLSSYPVRFNTKALNITQKEAILNLNLDPNLKTIFILGGSQGSKFINKIIQKTFILCPELAKVVQIIHHPGKEDLDSCKQFYQKQKIKSFVFEFYNQLEYCYQAADLIISRSGAGTLFEIVFFKKPCITIPLQTKSTSHQKDNALALQKQYPERIKVLNQIKLTNNPSLLLNAINSMLNLEHSPSL